MKRDNIYIFDKLTFVGSVLGEIQTEFNMSFVIDGTKDSCKIIVNNYSDIEIEPYSIIYHPKTMTWWVVSHDKIERYANEFNDDDEPTYLYAHNLELFGAIELLNARDLTDCGFNDNTYTIGEFILRLFSLSSFEYDYNDPIFLNAIDNNFLSKKVNFIKTFENYTLLSALREFLDAYNMVAKLDFSASYNAVTDKYTILYPMLFIVPKTGDFTNIYAGDYFDDVRQTKTIDKDSFGTCVVSNAENIISSVLKTFPSVGGVRLSSTQRLIADDTKLYDAVIRLPSNVYEGKFIKVVFPLQVTLFVQGTVTHNFQYTYNRTKKSFDDAIDFFEQKIIDETSDQSIVDEFDTYVDDELMEKFNLASVSTLYNGNKINAYTGDIIQGENVPYLASYEFTQTQGISGTNPVIFTDEDTKKCLPNIIQGISWKRGSNIISGFEMFDGGGKVQLNVNSTDYRGSANLIQFAKNGITITLSIGTQTLKDVHFGGTALSKQIAKLSFIIGYIPMSDAKVKVDNQKDKKDIQLYNQNGKLTDCVALSKLINSYSKEISSDTITKFMQCYSYNDVPKVGSVVLIDNQYYVINNVSLDFSQNEKTENDFGYFIEYEVTMSKYVSTKSLLVNPNTNIRDYGIPQNFNVKRKQLYRDYYELNYTLNSDNESTYYLDPSNIFVFDHEPNILPNYICVMKLTYDELIGGDGGSVQASDTWYYQLDTTNYYLDKMIYVMLDFNDNNIIGYGSQNVFSGFDITRVFTGLTDALNTPISYVDTFGKVLGIDILYCTNEQITTTYQEYIDEESGGSYEGSLYNYSVFIPEEIYTKSLNNHEIRISEDSYKKDALEVPVFEYACQIDDSDDVLIGDSILTQHDGCIYFYTYVTGDNLTQNNVEDTQTYQLLGIFPNWTIIFNRGARIKYSETGNKRLEIDIYESTLYILSSKTWTYGSKRTIPVGRDLAIFRHALKIDTTQGTVTDTSELVLIAKNIKNTSVDPFQSLRLILNHYKLN